MYYGTVVQTYRTDRPTQERNVCYTHNSSVMRRLTNAAEHRVINDWTASRPRKKRGKRWELTGVTLRTPEHTAVSAITANKLPRRRRCSTRSEIRQNRLRSKRRVYLKTPMFYCTEINARTAQLAHQTDERTKVGQTKMSLTSLSCNTPHISTMSNNTQEARKLNSADGADHVLSGREPAGRGLLPQDSPISPKHNINQSLSTISSSNDKLSHYIQTYQLLFMILQNLIYYK